MPAITGACHGEDQQEGGGLPAVVLSGKESPEGPCTKTADVLVGVRKEERTTRNFKLTITYP